MDNTKQETVLNEKQLEFVKKIKAAILESGIDFHHFNPITYILPFPEMPIMPQQDFEELYFGPPPMSDCLHDACPECNGTGIKKDGGMCIHMISCPCNKCSPH